MAAVVSNLHSVLRPGGQVLFRDYGLFDHAMLRFGRGHKIQEQFYMRQDGTRAYYFSQGQQLASNNNTLYITFIVVDEPFEVLECEA